MVDASARLAREATDHYAKLGGAIVGVATASAAAATAIAGFAGKKVFDFAAEGVEMATELQAQMSGIAAVMNKTAGEVAPLAELINQLAISPTLKVDTFEAANAIELLARNGLEMSEIMGGAALNTVLLANATNADFGTAADIATDVMQIFNIEAANMEQAVNGITSVIQNSKFDINDYGLALSRGGASAKAAGLSLEEFNGIVAFSASAFSSGMTSGTAWANFLVRLIPQSTEAAEAMRELGLFTGKTDQEFKSIQTELAKVNEQIASVPENAVYYQEIIGALTEKQSQLEKELVKGQNAFFDQNGNLKSMSEIIDILNGAFGDLSEEQRNAYAQMIFGRDAANALNSVIGKSGGEFAVFQDKLLETSAADSAATRMDNLAGAMEILRGIIQSIQIQIGQKFIPILTKLARIVSDVLEDKADQIVDVFSALADWFADTAEGLIPLVQRLLPQLIDNITNLAQWAIEAARTGNFWNRWLDELSPRLRRWIEQGREVYFVIKDMVGGLIEMAGRVRQFLKPLTDWMAANVTIEDVLRAAAGAVLAFMAPMLKTITIMAAVGAAAVAWATFTRKAWEENLGDIRGFTFQTWEQIKGIVNTTLLIIQEILNRHGGSLYDVVSTAWDLIKRVITGTLNVIQTILYLVLAAVRGEWETVWNYLEFTARRVWERLQQAWRDTLDAIIAYLQDNWPGWRDQLLRWANAAWEWIRDVAAPRAWEEIQRYGELLVAYLQDNWPGWRDQLLRWANAAWEWIRDVAMPRAWAEIQLWGSRLIAYLQDNWPAWRDQLLEWAEAAWTWIRDVAVPFALAQIQHYGTMLIDYLRANWPAWKAQLLEWANAAWEWIRDVAIPKSLEVLGEWVDKLVNFVQVQTPRVIEMFKNLWLRIIEESKRLWGEFVTWFEQKFPRTSQVIKDVWAEIKPLLDIIAQAVSGDFKGAWENFKIWFETEFPKTAQVLSTIWSIISPILTNFGNAIKALAPLIVQAVKGDIQGAWEGFKDWFEQEFPKTAAVLGRVWEEIKPLIGFIVQAVKGDLQGAWQGFKDWFATEFPKTTETLQKWYDEIKPIIDNIIALVTGEKSLKQAWQEFKDWFSEEFPKTTAVIERAIEVIGNLATATGLMIEAIELLLQGRFKEAWEKAQEAVAAAMGKTTKTVEDELAMQKANLFERAGKEILAWFEERFPKATGEGKEAIGRVSKAWASLSTTIEENQPKLDRLVAFLIDELVASLETTIKVAEALILLLAGDWPAAWQKAQEAVQTFFDTPARSQILTWLLEHFPNAINESAMAIEHLAEIIAGLDSDFGAAGEKIREKLNGLLAIVDNAFADILDVIILKMAQIVLAIGAATDLINGDWRSAWEKLVQIQELENERMLKKGIRWMADIHQLMLDSGLGATQGFGQGIDQGSPDAEMAVDQFGRAIIEKAEERLETKSPSQVFKRIGLSATAGMAGGVTEGTPSVVNTGGVMVTGFINKFINIPTDVVGYFSGIATAVAGVININTLVTVGQNLVQGFINGVNNMIQAARDKVAELMGLASQTADDANESQSPSKLYMRKGIDAAEGYLLGFEDHLAHEGGSRIHAALLDLLQTGQVDEFINEFHSAAKTLMNVSPELTQGLAEQVKVITQAQKAAIQESDMTPVQPTGTGLAVDPLAIMAMDTKALLADVFEKQGSLAFMNQFFKAGHIFTKADPAWFQMMTPLVKSLEDALGNPGTNFAEKVLADVRQGLGIKSDSKAFAHIGDMSARGFISGFESRMQQMTNHMAIAGAAPTYQSYATTNNMSNTFGPINVNTPMDLGEMEFRIRRIVAGAL